MTTKSTRPLIQAEKRKVKGKKIKTLRRAEILPANVYGKEIKSLAIQTDGKEIQKFFQQYGETTLIDLLIKGEKSPRPALMKNPQFDPVTDKLIHLDFHQVNLKEKVTADIPIEIYGEAPAVEKGEGVLVQVLNEVEVEALPTDLPEKITVDISKLEKVGNSINIADLKIETEKLKVNANPDQIVVLIEAPTKEEVVEAPAEEGAPTEGEKAEAPTPTEIPPSGETQKETKTEP